MPDDNEIMNRWLVIPGAVLVQICLGAIYAWSVFTPALIESGWTTMQTQTVFAVGLAFFAISMVLAGKKLTTWGPRKLTLISGLTLGLGYALAGLIGGTSYWALLLLIGIVGGTGIGIGYVVPIAVGMHWFPDKKGFITGIAVAGFGFGAMGWVKLAGAWGHLIEIHGLSDTFLMYGIAFTVLISIGSLWMVYPPEGWSPKGYAPPKETASTARSGLSGWDMVKTYQFKLIFLTFVFSAGAGLMCIGLMKLYPMESLRASGYGPSEASAIAGTAMAVFFSLANGIGRIAWGAMSDRIGRKTAIVLMCASQGLIVLAFPSMAGSEYALYAGAAFIGFNFGGNFALFPTITADTFGSTTVGRNYPFVFLAYGAGGILGPILGGMLGDSGNFPMAFTACGALCLLGAVFTWNVNAPGTPEERHTGLLPMFRRLAPARSSARKDQ